MTTTLITGITGQDASFLAESCLKSGHKVLGLKRRSSTDNLWRINHIKNDIDIIDGDVTDSGCMYSLFDTHNVDYCYNLCAQSHVGTSFKQPQATFYTNTIGPLNILEAIRLRSPHTRFYQASTSEMYGGSYDVIPLHIECKYLPVMVGGHQFDMASDVQLVSEIKFQNEKTKFAPNSPYAIAKLAAHDLVRNYRDSYNIFATAGILFNHESERRGEDFVTRKITKWFAEFKRWCKLVESIKKQGFPSANGEIRTDENTIFHGTNSFPKLRLGNVDAYRDWGYAGDYVEAMRLILEAETPNDYVVATGDAKTVREFLEIVYKIADVPYALEDIWTVDPDFYRPCEVDYLRGDPSKIKELGWEPKVGLEEMARIMFDADFKLALEKK